MAQCCTNTITPKMIRSGQMQIGDRIQLEDIVANAPDFQIKPEDTSAKPVQAEATPVSAPASEPAQAEHRSEPASVPVSAPVSEPVSAGEPESIPVQTAMYQPIQQQSQQESGWQQQPQQESGWQQSQPQNWQQPQTQIPHRFTTPLTYQQMTQYLDQSTINTQGSQPSITLPQTPMTTLEFTETIDMTDVQSYLGFLRTQIGRYMRVEQLMGSNVMENRYGFLVGIGSNYIILQEITTGNIQVIDLFTIRLTYIYYSDPVVPPEFPR